MKLVVPWLRCLVFAVVLFASARAEAAVERFGFVIGNNVGNVGNVGNVESSATPRTTQEGCTRR